MYPPGSHFLSQDHRLQRLCASPVHGHWHGTPAGIKSIKGLGLWTMCLFGRRWYQPLLPSELMPLVCQKELKQYDLDKYSPTLHHNSRPVSTLGQYIKTNVGQRGFTREAFYIDWLWQGPNYDGVGSKIIKDFCFTVPNLSWVTKGPFGIPEDTEVLIVIKACRLTCVYTGGLLIASPPPPPLKWKNKYVWWINNYIIVLCCDV